MGTILRGFGYAIAIILIIAGISLFSDVGNELISIVVIIIAIIMIWAIRQSGKVRHMQKNNSKGYDITKKCSSCSGSGRSSCYGCGGSGHRGFNQICLTCGGSGQMICTKCSGKGIVKN